MEMIEKIRRCLVEIGLVVDDDFSLETKLEDYLEDSIMFISFIVQIESDFGIEIGDDYLSPNKLSSVEDVINMIEAVSNESMSDLDYLI